MPVPNFSGLPPYPTFDEVANKVNKLVNELRNLLLNLDTLNISQLNADVVNAGTINANVVTVRGENGARFFQLDDTGIRANNGTIDTMKFDLATGLLTVISALIQSATGFPRVILDPTNNNFRIDQDSDTSIIFNPNYLGTTPIINFHDGSVDGYIGYFNALGKLAFTTPTSGVEMEISNSGASGDISLRPVDNLNVPAWSEIYNEVAMETLQQALDAKANGSGISGTVYVASTSGGPTTTAITFVNGVRTS